MAQKSGYNVLQIALHWGIAVLIGVNYIVSDGMEDAFDRMMEGGAVTGLTPQVHVWVGVAVLVLAALRLVVRMISGTPAKVHSQWPLMDRVGEWTHYALYALMLLVPFLGALSWFKMIDATAGLHVLTMNAMMILIGLHAVAALFHQFILRDGLLMRMLRTD